MEPTITTKDLIVTKPVEFNELKKGDIISVNFSGNEEVKLTHRITRIDKDKKWLYTKGDNNPSEDKLPTEYKYVVGKVIFILPNIGDIVVFFKSPLGIGILIGLLILAFVFDAIASKKLKKL
jgi:signal peptidase